MATTEDLDRIRTAYQEWHDTKGGSIDRWLELMAESIDFQSLAEGADPMAFTRSSRSRAELRGYFEGLVKEWEMLHYRVERLIHQDDWVVVIGHTGWRHRNTGKELHTAKVDIARVADSQIVEFREYYDTAQAFAAATD